MSQSLLGGRYQMEARIGAGGMAEVFRGFDPVLNRTVAIKVLNPQFARDTSFVERFRREAQAAARLNQPNIVAVYDTGADEGTQFIVMEFIEGRTLGEFMETGRKPTPVQAAEIAQKICAALAAAHAARRHPPRHQARQRHGDARRHREGDGLRHRARAGTRDRTADLGRARHRVLPVARAGAGRARGRAHRHLLAGRRALRDAHRPAAVHGRHPGGGRLQAGERDPGRALAAEPRRAARAWTPS